MENAHYKQGKVEVIDTIESYNLNFNLGNAVKYICRCNYKGDKVNDLKKAIWYIERELNYSENSTNANTLLQQYLSDGRHRPGDDR